MSHVTARALLVLGARRSDMVRRGEGAEAGAFLSFVTCAAAHEALPLPLSLARFVACPRFHPLYTAGF